MNFRTHSPAVHDEGPAPATLAAALAPWFARHQRKLAWRETRDPYAIWVSEIMLQQTRVDTVTRYWDGFLRRFPDVGTLAAADESEVLEAWSGLGYYRRARMLHRGARRVVEAHAGRLPDDAGGLREIPGIGRYTAGAIASIAFDRPEPLVDGNVARVLSRVHAIDDPVRQGADHGDHWDRVRGVLEHGSPRILAQALMELGATVCTPKNPACAGCPLREVCRARRAGVQGEIPRPRTRAPSPLEHYFALGLEHRGRLLLIKRAPGGLLAGLWCLPLVARTSAQDRPRTDQVRAALGRTGRIAPEVHGEVRHVFTHRVWSLVPLRLRTRTPIAEDENRAVIAPGERPRGGVPRATEKLLEILGY